MVLLLAAAACSGSGDGASPSSEAATTTSLQAATTGPDVETSSPGPTSADSSTSAPPETGTTAPPTTALVVPDWAEGFDTDGFAYFIDQVVGYFTRAEIVVVVDPQAGLVLQGGDEASFGLINLARSVLQNDRSDWPGIISDHFDRALATAGDPGPPEAWEDAEPSLRIRIYNRPFLEAAGGDVDQFVQSEIVRGLHATVVYDTPDAVRPITSIDTDSWDVDSDEIFDAALANTLSDPGLSVEAFELDDGTPLISLDGSFYASSFILDLPQAIARLGVIPDPGALVIVPVGDVAIVHLIDGETARDAVNVLGVIADGWYADGPSSLSPFVYWWRGGGLRELAIAVPDRGIALVEGTSDEFLAVIEGLTG